MAILIDLTADGAEFYEIRSIEEIGEGVMPYTLGEVYDTALGQFRCSYVRYQGKKLFIGWTT